MNQKKISLHELKKSWTKKLVSGFLDFDIDNYFEKKVDKFRIYYNEKRTQHSRNQSTQEETFIYSPKHHTADDEFCKNRETIWSKQKIGEFTSHHHSWDVLTNNPAINEFHSIIFPKETNYRQHLNLPLIEDLLNLSKQYNSLSIGVNSWGAGASQNHFHAHIFFSPLPITNWPKVEISQKDGVTISKPNKYPAVILMFSSKYDSQMCKVVDAYIKDLMKKKIPYNMLLHNKKIYLAPRKRERDEKGFKRGADSIFGSLPTTTPESFKTFDIKNAYNTLHQIGFDLEEANILFDTKSK